MKKVKSLIGELQKMQEIRIEQKNVRIALQKREERNKELRSKITAIWTDKEKDEQVQGLSKELVEGRAKTRKYQKLLREFKVNLRGTNRLYDLSISNRIG